MTEYTANLELERRDPPSWTVPSKLDRRLFIKPTIWQRIKAFLRRL